MNDIKDIIEILELSKEEIENNNENVTATLDLQDLKSLKNLYELYQKEKEKNKELLDKNKIIKILGFDENTSNDTIYRNIEILVSEFERLEDIEDRKVQVEYDFVFNQGVRSIEKKIKEKIKELENNNYAECIEFNQEIINILQELLEERN